MASQRKFTQISSVDDIIIHIYKYLDFEDQLRLSRVNSQMKIIFKTYIWKEEYASLKVYQTVNTPYFCAITSEERENRVYLNRKEYKEFLLTYADDVLKLTIQYDEDRTVDPDVYLNYFKNLVSFNYEQHTIPVDLVQLIAMRNTNLQELTLKSIYNNHVTDELINYTLPEMFNLKRLRIVTNILFDLTFSQLQAILRKPKLESLKLSAVIVWDGKMRESEKALTIPIGLNEFDLGISFEPQKFPPGITSYFRNLKFLTDLCIYIIDKVTEEILATIAETCNCLKKLRFERTDFSDVQVFRVPISVIDFSLCMCLGVSHGNLKQILTQYNITKFDSLYTKYSGEFEDFDISPRIESLHINDFPTLQFESAYKANTNLKELTWYHLNPMTSITPSFPLKQFTNLDTLNLVDCQMNLNTLLELKSLRKLVISHPPHLLQWPFITQLLQQHLFLRELIVKHMYSYDTKYPRMDHHVGFATQVCSLEIPFDMFVSALDFWIDLFAENKSLVLVCCESKPSAKFGKAIENIVNHRNLPKSVKKINFCGFLEDCEFIRNHYEDYLMILKIQKYNSRYWYKDENFRITLKRN